MVLDSPPFALGSTCGLMVFPAKSAALSWAPVSEAASGVMTPPVGCAVVSSAGPLLGHLAPPGRNWVPAGPSYSMPLILPLSCVTLLASWRLDGR
jgi:hypothetical protein